MSMQRVKDGKTPFMLVSYDDDEGCYCTLSVSGVSRVDVEGLLTLSDGGGQGKVSLHHPLLVVAINDCFRGHGERVTLGYILGQGGE